MFLEAKSDNRIVLYYCHNLREKKVKNFPKTAKMSFKQHMTAITAPKTKEVVSRIKSKGAA